MDTLPTLSIARSKIAWRAAAIFAVITGGLTRFVEFEGFIGNYWFDMAFPVFLYIYLRKTIGISRKFNSIHLHPITALVLATGPALFLELLQYFGIYKGTFDLFDLIAYFSLAFPAYLIDKWEIASLETSTAKA